MFFTRWRKSSTIYEKYILNNAYIRQIFAEKKLLMKKFSDVK